MRRSPRILLWVALALVVVLAGPIAGLGSAAPAGAARERDGDADVRERPEDVAIVRLRPGADPRVAARALGVVPIHVYRHVFTGFAAELPAVAASASRRSGDVVEVSPDLPTAGAAQVVPTGVRRIGRGGTDLLAGLPATDADVAVLDSGVNASAELSVAGGTACVGDGIADLNGHGTHVAGIVAARNNRGGVVGAAPGARIWSIRVLGRDNTGWISDAICGLDWVYANRATIDVVNMSLGGPGYVGPACSSSAYRTAVCRVVEAGIPIAAAAGNQGGEMGEFTPAAFPEVVAVAALADSDGRAGGRGPKTCTGDADDTLARFSNYGEGVDIAAPGACIRSLGRKSGSVVSMSGTSMASPHVAGALALFKAGRPNADANDARAWLLSDAASQGATSGSGFTGRAQPQLPRVLFVEG
jgi:subtilisin family serine protease